MTGLMTTVIAVAGSILILGEALMPQLMGGGLMTLLGIGLILFRNQKNLPANMP